MQEGLLVVQKHKARQARVAEQAQTVVLMGEEDRRHAPEQEEVVKISCQLLRQATSSAIGASTPPACDLSPARAACMQNPNECLRQPPFHA